MAEDVFDDAIVDVVGPESLLSEPVVVKVCSAAAQFSSCIFKEIV